MTVAGLGSYRVLAGTARDGDTVVTGLPLADLDDTIFWLVGLQAALSGAALLAAGLAAAVIVRRTLRPLHRVATLATHVTALPLARGEVELDERVPAADTDPAPRSVRSGPRSTSCSTMSAAPCLRARPARRGSGSSSPMPATSCALRWRRSGATPSSPGGAASRSPRTSRTRWCGSSPRPSG